MKFIVNDMVFDVELSTKWSNSCYVVWVGPSQNPVYIGFFDFQNNDVYVYGDTSLKGYYSLEKLLPNVKIALGMFCSLKEITE